jgi:hypothetical protein
MDYRFPDKPVIPTKPAVFDDSELLRKSPWTRRLRSGRRRTRAHVAENAVTRRAGIGPAKRRATSPLPKFKARAW